KSHAALMLEEAHGEASRAAEAALAAPVTQVSADRREVEAELAYLRTFSDVYRTHLHASLDALLRNVEEWARAEKTPLGAGDPARRGRRRAAPPPAPSSAARADRIAWRPGRTWPATGCARPGAHQTRACARTAARRVRDTFRSTDPGLLLAARAGTAFACGH